MTFSLKHTFTSPKADGTDSTLVQPSNWNAEHTITLGAGKVLGRDASSAGAVQEMSLTFDATQQSMIPPSGTTAQRPSTPLAGMLRYNTTTSKFELYNGTIWGSVGGGASISDTAPTSPQAGDLWWKSDEGQMYVYYNDGNSSQWVIGNAFAGGPGFLSLTGGTISGNLSVTGTATFGGQVVPLNAPSTAGNVLTSNGTAWVSQAPSAGIASAIGQIPFSTNGTSFTPTQKIVQGTTVASTSGTSIDFTGIPSWVKRVTVMFQGVSTSGTSNVQILLGTSGGPAVTGYLGSLSSMQAGVASVVFSSGFVMDNVLPSAANLRHGIFIFTNLNANIWAMVGNMGYSNTAVGNFMGGSLALGGALDRVRITTVNGTDTFDAGSINIMYE